MPTLPVGVTQSPRSQKGTVTFILDSRGAGVSTAITVDLPIAPDDIDLQIPSRQQVTQTLTGAYQDHLGAGLMTLKLRGHTGWRGNQTYIDGRAAMDALKGIMDQYDRLVAERRPDDIRLHCLLNVPDGWQSYRVSKNSMTIQRSKQSPLLFRYEVDLTILEDLNSTVTDPSPNFVISLAQTIPLPLFIDPHIVAKTNIVAATTANQFDCGMIVEAGITLGTLATRIYGARGFSNPARFWSAISAANPSVFPVGRVTSQTIVPVGVIGTGSMMDGSICLHIPSFALDDDAKDVYTPPTTGEFAHAKNKIDVPPEIVQVVSDFNDIFNPVAPIMDTLNQIDRGAPTSEWSGINNFFDLLGSEYGKQFSQIGTGVNDALSWLDDVFGG